MVSDGFWFREQTLNNRVEILVERAFKGCWFSEESSERPFFPKVFADGGSISGAQTGFHTVSYP